MQHFVLEILILRPMSPAAVANLSKISCISVALCATRTLSSTNSQFCNSLIFGSSHCLKSC